MKIDYIKAERENGIAITFWNTDGQLCAAAFVIPTDDGGEFVCSPQLSTLEKRLAHVHLTKDDMIYEDGKNYIKKTTDGYKEAVALLEKQAPPTPGEELDLICTVQLVLCGYALVKRGEQ